MDSWEPTSSPLHSIPDLDHCLLVIFKKPYCTSTAGNKKYFSTLYCLNPEQRPCYTVKLVCLTSVILAISELCHLLSTSHVYLCIHKNDVLIVTWTTISWLEKLRAPLHAKEHSPNLLEVPCRRGWKDVLQIGRAHV